MNEEYKGQLALLISLPLVILLFVVFNIIYIRLDVHNINTLKVAGLALAFIAHTFVLKKWILETSLTIILSLIYLMVAGLLPFHLYNLYWLTGIICSALLFYDLSKIRDLSFWIKTVSACIVFSLLLVPYFNLPYSQPFNVASLSRDAVHIDNFYHVAIASMIKNYQQVSHGLHGLGQLEYHFGSHLLMASAANLLNISTFASYSYFFPFFLIPLFCIVILLVAEEFYPSAGLKEFFFKCILILFAFLGSGIFLDSSLLYRFALWPSFFESESYTVSLIFFLLFMSLLRKIVAINWSTAIFIILIITLTSLSKVSTGFCGLTFLGSWALLTKSKWFSKQWMWQWLVFFVCGLLFLLIFKIINSGKGDGDFSPLHFVKSYISFNSPMPIKILLMILLHFIFPVSALVLFVREHKTLKIFAQSWWALGTLLITLLGIGVLLSLSIVGGSAYYFSNVSMFAAIPLVLNIGQMNVFKRSRIFKTVIMIIMITGFGLYFYRVEWRAINIYVHLMRLPPDDNALQKYINNLIKIRDDKLSLDGVVYIPKTETKFHASMSCRKISYFLPAISERPQLYAWPSFECYDFLCGDRFHSNGLCELSQKNYNDEQLLSEAHRLGFKKVFIVTYDGIRTLQ